jgi:hypothetical protein
MFLEEDYEIIEYTTEDHFWYEYYGTFKEVVSLIREAAIFLINDGSRW